ncbi:MAG: mechanosensitive ion channel family protein [Myxococcota bacterium]|jgi:small conductance mechanosensitive channel|nr:mechanosensitive ion channel family protein [Myxococcota bacterium]
MRWMGPLALMSVMLFVNPTAWGQETAAETATRKAPPSAPVATIPAAAQDAFESWTEALSRKPALVSLGSLEVQSQDDKALEDALRRRLALLGRKKVSNRQWKDYWTKQATMARDLGSQLTGAPSAGRAAGLAAWAALANDKVANQDRYLQAIEDERDAIEERLEATLAHGTSAEGTASTTAPAGLGINASPFEARQHHIAELTHRIRQQEQKQATTEIAKKHSERQTATQGIMATALAKDLALAKRERDIAEAQAGPGTDTWSVLWTGIHTGANAKVKSLADEVALGEQRVRSLEVELSLLTSQIGYRTKKKAELEAQLVQASSTGGWFVAVRDTAVAWVAAEGWQVALMLLLLWIAVKLTLRLIDTFTRTILKVVEDDDPDSVSQEEARAKTIGSVFRSVARVAVVIIGSLMALETLGVNTGPILGSVAILGLAISFGSQSLVKDIVTGFFILLENQFAVGDVVTVSGQTGTVEHITLRATQVRQSNGTLHVIPNGQIGTVANLTRDWSRATVHPGVGYDSDLRDVERVVNATGEALFAEADWDEKLEEAPYFVGVTQLGDSAVVVRVTAKVQPGAQWEVERELNRRLLEALIDAGVDIPFPQQVVWHQNAPQEAAA